MSGKYKTGQQIIEYLLLFAVVVVVILAFAGPRGPFRKAVNGILNGIPDMINREINNLNRE